MSKFTCTIDKTEIYRLRGDHTWADFVIDSQKPGCGQLLINSDYGSWAYYWSHIGLTYNYSFKAFLAKIEDDYFIGKLNGVRDYFDEVLTKKAIKEHITDAFDNRDTVDMAAYAAAIELIDNCDWYNVTQVYDTLMDDDNGISHLFDPSDIPYVLTAQPGLIRFVERIYPEFRKILLAELAAANTLEPQVK